MSGIKDFSVNMEAARKKADLYQKDIAERTGLTKATISAYESATKFPSLENALKIAEVLGTTVDELCGISSHSSPQTYADFLKLFLDVAEFLNVDLCFDSSSQQYKEQCITYENETVSNFMIDWAKIKRLYSEGTIDQELYEAWKMKKWHDFGTIPLYKEDGTVNDVDKENRKKDELNRMGIQEFNVSDDDDLPF